MMPHDILTLYSAKAIEYLIAVAFLVLFVPFWRFAMGTATAAPAHAPATGVLDALTHWFAVPDRTFFHPGHAWARMDGDGVLTVGVDDFAQKLVGPLGAVRLPHPGARLEQGEPAWSLAVDGKAVDMVAPVGGTVLAVNHAALERPSAINEEPYGHGWLLKVQSPRAAAHLAALRSGQAARRWMDEVCETLTASLTPSLGLVYQDGGTPVDGIAHAVAGDDWDTVARRFLLTDDATPAPAASTSAPDAREKKDEPVGAMTPAMDWGGED